MLALALARAWLASIGRKCIIKKWVAKSHRDLSAEYDGDRNLSGN